MTTTVLIDANLLVLFVVGSASVAFIERHKRLGDFTPVDLRRLVAILSRFDRIALVPHVLAETSNLSRYIGEPARAIVSAKLANLIEHSHEAIVPSVFGVRRAEYPALGLTDAVLLHLCSADATGRRPTLLTVDTVLADSALSIGCDVIDYRRTFLSD